MKSIFKHTQIVKAGNVWLHDSKLGCVLVLTILWLCSGLSFIPYCLLDGLCVCTILAFPSCIVAHLPVRLPVCLPPALYCSSPSHRFAPVEKSILAAVNFSRRSFIPLLFLSGEAQRVKWNMLGRAGGEKHSLSVMQSAKGINYSFMFTSHDVIILGEWMEGREEGRRWGWEAVFYHLCVYVCWCKTVLLWVVQMSSYTFYYYHYYYSLLFLSRLVFFSFFSHLFSGYVFFDDTHVVVF